MSKNKVELIGWYGGDRVIARTAWTSTQIDVNKKTEEQVRDLIVNKLWNNGHHPHKTPFERGIVEFNILVDQASHIHQLKHRLAQVNGESARYMELKGDNYYLPEDWKGIKVSEDIYDCTGENLLVCKDKDWYYVLSAFTQDSNTLYHKALKDLAEKLGRKRAKESARFFKLMNSQITLSVMMNMSCFYNFYTLRADDTAQDEIHYIADAMLDAIANIEGNPFKYTLEAFNLKK